MPNEAAPLFYWHDMVNNNCREPGKALTVCLCNVRYCSCKYTVEWASIAPTVKDHFCLRALTPMGNKVNPYLTYLKSFLENNFLQVCWYVIKVHCIKISLKSNCVILRSEIRKNAIFAKMTFTFGVIVPLLFDEIEKTRW